MQPLGTSFFHPLKEIWKRIVPQWKVENNKTRLTRQDFAEVLKLAIDSFPGAKNAVKNGFRATGFVPFNPEALDYDVLNKRKKKKLLMSLVKLKRHQTVLRKVSLLPSKKNYHLSC